MLAKAFRSTPLTIVKKIINLVKEYKNLANQKIINLERGYKSLLQKIIE
jgi:hypothetical protein